MTLDTRKGIAHGLDCGLAFAEMAGMFHRTESTTANEVKNRMIWSNKGYGCTNDVCERFETCSKVFRTSCGKKLPFKNQRKCFEMCEDYVRKTCPKLGRAPFVCNGCAEQSTRPLRKRFYRADAAQENYRGILGDAHRGTQADEKTIADMNAALKEPIRTGMQSIRAVRTATPTAFHGFSEKCVCNYANSRLFDVTRRSRTSDAPSPVTITRFSGVSSRAVTVPEPENVPTAMPFTMSVTGFFDALTTSSR